MRTTALAGLLSGLLVLAGCAATSTPSQSGGGDALAPTPRPDDSTGSLEGTVVDDETRPVSGADVSIAADAPASTRTDAQGRYVLNDLAAGDYNLYVAALGYESGARRVTIVAGQTSRADFVLAAIAVREPRESTRTFQGYWNCALMYTAGIQPCPAYVDGTYSNRFTYPVEGNYSAILWEVDWTPSAAVTHPSQTKISIYTDDPDYYHGQVQSPPPGRVLARPGGEAPFPDKDAYPSSTKRTAIYAHPFGYFNQGQYGLGLVLNQRYEVFVTVFYDQEMADDYSAIPDK